MGRHDEARIETTRAQSAVPRRAVVGSGAAGVGLGIATFMLPSSTAAASTLEVATDAFAVLLADSECSTPIGRYTPFLVVTRLPEGEEYRFSFTGQPSGTWYEATTYQEDGWDTNQDVVKFDFADPAGCDAVPPSSSGYLGRFTTGGALIAISQQFDWWDV